MHMQLFAKKMTTCSMELSDCLKSDTDETTNTGAAYTSTMLNQTWTWVTTEQ